MPVFGLLDPAFRAFDRADDGLDMRIEGEHGSSEAAAEDSGKKEFHARSEGVQGSL